jgi:hypothetical protein
METEAQELEADIIQAYVDTQVKIARDIERYKNSVNAGLDIESSGGKARLKNLKSGIALTIASLGDTIEDIVRQAKDLGVEKGRVVVNGSRKELEIRGLAWSKYLSTNAQPYLDSGLLLEKFPSSVKTYGDLVTFFSRQDTVYFKQLKNIIGGDINNLVGLAWNPLEDIRRQLRSATAERISYGELVTRLRQEVWRLPANARVPNVTFQATRLARTEMMSSAALSQKTWGYETPGIYGFRRWFGGGACDGSCLQYVGYWSYNGNQPVDIPVHPNCGCYDTYETEPRPKQHDQQVYLLENNTYIDRMTFEHNSVIAERLGQEMPTITNRYTLQGSNRFGEPFLRADGRLDRSAMLEHITTRRLQEIN